MATIRKSLFAVLLLATTLFVAPDSGSLKIRTLAAQTYSMRINAGGGSYVSGEKTWQADQAYAVGSWGYVGGNTVVKTDPIANTTDDALYQSERYDMSAYRFAVPNGRYRVDLHFAEIVYSLPGKRVFSVLIESRLVASNLDIFAAAGHDVALVKTFKIEVMDGILDIDFGKIIELPKISAIEIWSINTGMRSAVVMWDANTEADLKGYKVYYGESPRSYQFAWDNGMATTDTVRGLVEGRTYFFAVTAYDSSGNESGYSQEVAYTVPLAAPELTILFPANNQQIFADSVIVQYSISGDVAKAARMLVTLDGVTDRVLFAPQASGRFTIKPIATGTHLLSMSLFDSSDSLIGSVKTVTFYVKVPDMTAPAAPQNLRVVELKTT